MQRDDFFSAVGADRQISFSEKATNAERSIEPAWLVEAMQNPANVIALENALISGEVFLYSRDIQARVEMIRCDLPGLRICYCSVRQFFDLSRSRIAYIDCRGSTFSKALWLRDAVVHGRLDLGYVNVSAEVDLDGLNVLASFYACGLDAAKSVHMRRMCCKGNVELSSLNPRGQVDVKDAICSSDFSMRDADIAGFIAPGTSFADLYLERSIIRSSVFMSPASVKVLNCHSARVLGQFVLLDCNVEGLCFLEGLDCQDLCIRRCTFREPVSAIGAHAFAIDVDDCCFSSLISLNDVRVDAGVGFTDSEGADIRFDRARIEGSLVLQRRNKEVCVFDALFLFGTQIRSQLILDGIRINTELVMESARIDSDCQFMAGSVLGGIENPMADVAAKLAELVAL